MKNNIKKIITLLILVSIFLAGCSNSSIFRFNIVKPKNIEQLLSISLIDAEKMQSDYQEELDQFNRSYSVFQLPETDFFLFGMGNRQKMIYKDGILKDSFSSETIREWTVRKEIIVPPQYLVILETAAGKIIKIAETDDGVWIIEGERFTRLSKGRINLPMFDETKYPLILRVLHHEVLINIIDNFPTPNYLVYPEPWYRDAALAAMVLEKTDNLHLIKKWIEDIREPFDLNNAGIEEPDNLGQVLFLVSLVSDKDHPVVSTILEILPRFEKDNHIEGLTDFSTHSVYQTLWLKYGLSALGLEDKYKIPQVKDSYASLFWIDYKDQIMADLQVFDSPSYPYLMTAQNHFFDTNNGYVSSRPYPLTWEANASAAQYEGMTVISDEYPEIQLAAPHGWHAAELFLLLYQD